MGLGLEEEGEREKLAHLVGLLQVQVQWACRSAEFKEIKLPAWTPEYSNTTGRLAWHGDGGMDRGPASFAENTGSIPKEETLS